MYSRLYFELFALSKYNKALCLQRPVSVKNEIDNMVFYFIHTRQKNGTQLF